MGLKDHSLQWSDVIEVEHYAALVHWKTDPQSPPKSLRPNLSVSIGSYALVILQLLVGMLVNVYVWKPSTNGLWWPSNLSPRQWLSWSLTPAGFFHTHYMERPVSNPQMVVGLPWPLLGFLPSECWQPLYKWNILVNDIQHQWN